MVLGSNQAASAKQKIANSRTGKKWSLAVRQKMSASHMNNVQSDEEKAKRKATWAAKKAAKLSIDKQEIIYA